MSLQVIMLASISHYTEVKMNVGFTRVLVMSLVDLRHCFFLLALIKYRSQAT